MSVWLGKAGKPLERGVDQLGWVFHSVGAGVLVAMMLVIATDVCLRYFLNRPILGSYEIISYMMVIVVALGIAYTAVHKGHINVELVVSRFPQSAQAVVESTVTLVGFILFGLITWQSVEQAKIMHLSGTTSEVLGIPVYPFVWVVVFGSALLSLVLLVHLCQSISRAVKQSRHTWVYLLLGTVVVLLLGAVLLWGQPLLGKVNPLTAGFIGIGVLILLLLSGMPIGFVMGVVGFLGMAYLSSTGAALTLLATVPYATMASYNLSVIPLFILMGEFCFFAGISQELYMTVYKWLGQLRGGLAMATVGACAAFAAVSGSSPATAATMGAVALPEMKRYKYDSALATGSIAAGGTIGILIPPSVILIIYGVITEQSIGKLFLAGFFPGVLEALFYMITIYILCKRNPLMGPPAPRTSFIEKVVSLRGTWVVLVLFVVVIGGIYLGVFSPTEAAGVGAFGSLIFALGKRKLSRQSFTDSIMETVKTTAMIFIIMVGAMILGYFLAVTRLPFQLADIIAGLAVNRYIIMGIILIVYIFLGCIMDPLAMILLTVPIFFPLILALGFDPIWFGIIIVRVCEMGLITPPVGLNVFIIKGVAKDVPMYTIFRGIVPFLMADICHVALLVAVPQISLFLPSLMK